MIPTRFRMVAFGLVTLALAASHALADELIGEVRAIDANASTVVIKEKGTDKETTITVGSKTSWYNEKKAKISKKYDLSKLKIGSEVEVTRDGTTVSKVVVKEKKKKKAA